MPVINATARWLMTGGAIMAALAVVAGAFGAHALRERLGDQMLSAYQTAVQYHFYHALGLILLGVIALHVQSSLMRWSGVAMLVGIVLFSGSLYLLALTGARWLGMVTPVGGTAFIAAWLLLAAALLRKR